MKTWLLYLTNSTTLVHRLCLVLQHSNVYCQTQPVDRNAVFLEEGSHAFYNLRKLFNPSLTVDDVRVHQNFGMGEYVAGLGTANPGLLTTWVTLSIVLRHLSRPPPEAFIV